MAEEPEVPSAAPEDSFGPPHSQRVSDSLQMYMLIPGLLILLVVGYLIYHLLSSQRNRVKKKEEKKRLKQEKKEKKKGK